MFEREKEIVMCLMIILVGFVWVENVGVVVRVMKIMGFCELWIVDSEVYLVLLVCWVVYGLGDIFDGIIIYFIFVEVLYDVDFIVVIIVCSCVCFYYYVMLQQLLLLLEEKVQWMNYIVLVFGCEDVGLINEELVLVDVLIGVLMVVDYLLLNFGQLVMVYCY